MQVLRCAWAAKPCPVLSRALGPQPPREQEELYCLVHMFNSMATGWHSGSAVLIHFLVLRLRHKYKLCVLGAQAWTCQTSTLTWTGLT
jgi:hypothetical protein